MSLAKDIKAAKQAVDKLNAYSDGVAAAGGKDATTKYLELNRKANAAIAKLPAGVLRSRIGLDLAAAISKFRG